MLQTIDFYIIDAIQNIRCGFLDAVMPKITMLGSAGFIWILLAVVLCAKKDSRKTGFMLIAGLLAGLIIGNGILKNIIARDRPSWLNPEIILLIENPTDFSFPSGHTLSSFTCAFILLFRKDRLRFPALVLAILISFSRLYLYVHFLSDVLSAVILSALIAYIVSIVVPRRRGTPSF